MPVAVHKFGGSSVASAAHIVRLADILSGRAERQVVVVSAMSGVTDALIALTHAAAARASWKASLDALFTRHVAAMDALIPNGDPVLAARLEDERESLTGLLRTQSLMGALSHDLLDAICGLGEVYSSLIVQAYLTWRGFPSMYLDARDVVVVSQGELGALVDWAASTARLATHPARDAACVVATGFIASTSNGRVTTLGRNGSDYSAAIFGALFRADEVTLWSDVDGVYSADPRLVPEAILIERLTYSEAFELAYFGAKVIHPQTMAPALHHHIPIFAKSSVHPDRRGTRIDAFGDIARPVKGVTSVSGLGILNLEGAGMIGVPGTSERAFRALKDAQVSVVMISQGSSEHSICCVIRERDGARAKAQIEAAFAAEIENGLIEGVTFTADVAALAVVGDGMAGTPGTAARLFKALGTAHVNVMAIAQGSSERSISVAVLGRDVHRAVRAVHSGFYLAPNSVSVGLLGPGKVGLALLRQLQGAAERLRIGAKTEFWVRAIANSSTMVLGEPRLAVAAPQELMANAGPLDLDALVRHVRAGHLPRSVIIDCTASPLIAGRYQEWLAAGIDVVAANKHAGAGPLESYQSLFGHAGVFRYEATVGAGLPIITTLRDLVDTGDDIRSIEGIFSGTLAYLFNAYDGSVPFSQLVHKAKEAGYTEADPREDLSGMDVARKLVILARECGMFARLENVELESLVPFQLRGVSTAAFLERVGELDAPMRDRLKAANAANKVLRYVARVDAGGSARVGLLAVDRAHQFAHLRLTDNMVQFTTRRYADNPLVVAGPGAGPEVTAAGVFADLLRVATSSSGGAR